MTTHTYTVLVVMTTHLYRILAVMSTSSCSSLLNYTNSALYSITHKNIWKLQKAQNRLKWGVSCLNSNTLLQQLHWLPIEYRINVKIAHITFNTLHYSQPAYLHSLLHFHSPAHSLTSSNTNLLTIPFAHTSLGARSFSVASCNIWNSLPPALCSCYCPDTFRQHFKTHYF